MPDGPLRKVLKKLLRALYLWELRVRRARLRALRQDTYRLAGSCAGCARCCEEPSITLSALVWYLVPLRKLLVLYQWHMNRFELVRSEPQARLLAFRCAHFDVNTRLCDSYDSRPGVCMDYPRYQLDQAWPELFDECGYRAVARGAEGLSEALDRTGLTVEERERLKRRLHVLK
jgi:uncharacterized protein